MAETEVLTEAKGEEKNSPLADLFPGRTFKISTGQVVTIRKWSAREVIHEVPAILGRLLLRVAGPLKAASQDPESALTIVPIMLGGAAGEVSELLAFTTSTPIGTLENLPADEFLMLVRTMIEENVNFFAEVAKIYDLAKQGLPGT